MFNYVSAVSSSSCFSWKVLSLVCVFMCVCVSVVVGVAVVYLNREKQRMLMNQKAPERLEMLEYDDIGQGHSLQHHCWFFLDTFIY